MLNFIKKLSKFTKIEHTIFSLPLLLSGAYIGGGYQFPHFRTLFFIFLAGVGARVLGMAMNRILDRKIDAMNPRTSQRELASGGITLSSAYLIALSGTILYLIACFSLNNLVLMLSPIPIILLTAYSFLKRFTCFCHFGIGVSLGIAPVGAYLAVSGQFYFVPEIYLLSLFTFFWISGFDIVYGLQDINFDRTHNIHSIPAKLGANKAQIVSSLCHFTATLLLITLTYMTNHGILALVALLISIGAFVFANIPSISPERRFFPVSVIPAICASIIPLLN